MPCTILQPHGQQWSFLKGKIKCNTPTSILTHIKILMSYKISSGNETKGNKQKPFLVTDIILE